MKARKPLVVYFRPDILHVATIYRAHIDMFPMHNLHKMSQLLSFGVELQYKMLIAQKPEYDVQSISDAVHLVQHLMPSNAQSRRAIDEALAAESYAIAARQMASKKDEEAQQEADDEEAIRKQLDDLISL